MQSRTRQSSLGVSNDKTEVKQRSSNIEMLRIIAMVGIVISHLTFSSPHGSAIIAQHNFETYYLALLETLGQIGVLLFFLITGYFSVNREFSLKGVSKLASLTWIYSIAGFIFALLIGFLGLGNRFNLDNAHTSLTLQSVLINLMPIIQSNYWFITAYIVIIFLSPALNKILMSTTHNRLAATLFGITVAFFGLNYLSRAFDLGLTFEIYNNLLLYSLVYSIGAYLRLFPLKVKTSVISSLLVITFALSASWIFRLVFISHSADILNKDIDFAPFLFAIGLFCLFIRLKVPHNAFVNIVGGSTLAVYLIHANRNIWEPLWKIFDVYKVHNTAWFYLFPFVVGIAIFSLCILLELGRQYVSRKIHTTTTSRVQAALVKS